MNLSVDSTEEGEFTGSPLTFSNSYRFLSGSGAW